MSARAFLSYSHADEKALERLHKHLAVLRRDGSLAAWTDHAILAGDNLDDEITAQLEESDLFIAIVSPDYLASKYCYEREFQRALERAEGGAMRIVAIIIEPCDWLSTPLHKLMALPKDGKPISEWTNPNNAYLDVVTQLRRLLSVKPADAGRAAAAAPVEQAARRVRLKRDFDAIEKAEFVDRTYQVMRRYFEEAAAELSQASEDLRTRLEDMDQNAFTCSLVNRARQSGGEAHITVRNAKGRESFHGDLSYIFEKHAAASSSHGGIRVEADDYQLFLTTERFSMGRDGTVRFTPERVAEWLWNEFVQRAGVEYE